MPRTGGTGGTSEPGLDEDFGELLKTQPGRFRILDIRDAKADFHDLTLIVAAVDGPNHRHGFYEIKCFRPLDYSIRPPNPMTMAGGPEIEYHEQHPLIDKRGQFIAGGDGEVYDPPRKVWILVLDQSYVIAERFQIRELKAD